MSHAKAIAAARPATPTLLVMPITAISVAIRAMLGSLLGISTAALFGISVLVLGAGVRPDVAITVVALALNAMLFSLVLLGSLSDDAQD